MFGLNMWVRPFGHPSVSGATDQQANVVAPQLAALPYSVAPWMFLAQRASNASATASIHGAKTAPIGTHSTWPPSTGTDSASLAHTEKLLELHRKLMSPHHPAYVSSITPTELRMAADRYSGSFRQGQNTGHSEPEPGECGTSSVSTIAGYYPSAFIPPKRPRIDSKGSVSPARSSCDRDSSTPSGDARSKSCSPRGSVGSRCSPLPHDGRSSEEHNHGQSPHSMHQPWLSPSISTNNG